MQSIKPAEIVSLRKVNASRESSLPSTTVMGAVVPKIQLLSSC